ncbi:MAG: 1-deoxy-D-xylulose-5-phosphate reductoisomerase [Gammaproteobacteria bacterium WSBS_2016_MAG_OTU1]
MAKLKRVCILGATGSVGGGALSVIRDCPQMAAAVCLVANNNAVAMRDLCREFQPQRAIMREEAAAEELNKLLAGDGIIIDGGEEAVQTAATAEECDTVIAGIAGGGGLAPTLHAARSGRQILLANKESLVIAGELLMQTAREHGAEILPIDSEHAALFELLEGERQYTKLWLTASGGALRDMPLAQLPNATLAQTLSHPTWKMGNKITVDSATMMNKVLEIIEATVLFQTTAAQVGVVIHPQSIVHALVEDSNGVLSAQMSFPDMRLPIARMLFRDTRKLGDELITKEGKQPQNAWGGGRSLTWETLSNLSFYEPDLARYPCLPLADEALALGGAAPAILSAANELAVERFLRSEIKFTDIARINARALATCAPHPAATLADLQAANEQARAVAAQ